MSQATSSQSGEPAGAAVPDPAHGPPPGGSPYPPRQDAGSASGEAAYRRPVHDAEAVWTYRGYQLRASEFTTAMVHLFRAEVQRANVWRQRLDTTTNWAVITTAASISIAFSRPAAEDHRVIILNVLLVTLFLWMEARRDRYYELWSYRVRLMETDFFAPMLVPPFHPAADWAESLAETLLHPQFPVSLWEALGRRYRRNYLWIYVILGLAWISKVWLHPDLAAGWPGLFERAGIGTFRGELVLVAGVLFNVALLLLGILTANLQQAPGEVLPRYGAYGLPGEWRRRPRNDQRRKAAEAVPGSDGTPTDPDASPAEPATPGPYGRPQQTGWQAWFRPSRRRQQLLAYIVTDQAEAVGQRILSDLSRGVTALSGTGLYTHQPHAVLICALTVTEVAHLKAAVMAEDPQAFVIVSPVHEVLGRGFQPLDAEP